MVKRLLLLLACLFALFGRGTVSADYLVTEQQITALESKLSVLATDNSLLMNQQMKLNSDLKQARTQLNESNSQIVILKQQLTESKNEVEKVKRYSKETNDLLKNAETSLQILEDKDKSKDKRIKWLQIALAGVAVFAFTR